MRGADGGIAAARQPPSAPLRAAVAHLDAPFGVIDLDAFDANIAALAARAGGTPIRIASKSLRCVAAIERALAHPGFRGVLAFTLAEALELAARGIDDIVVAYPTTERDALARLLSDERALERITLMVDSTEHVELLATALKKANSALRGMPGSAEFAHSRAGEGPVRVCVDVDASFRPLEGVRALEGIHTLGARLHLGVRRSPVRTPADAGSLARRVAGTPGLRLVGLMLYEAQIAGVPDGAPGARGAIVRRMQAASDRELRRRRALVVAAVERALREAGAPPLEFVNGGGTGSIERTAADAVVTELAAGSGLYAPTLFDGYRGFRHRPAAYAVLQVARRPDPGIVTLLGGGWIASGPPGVDRQPSIAWPEGLTTLRTEGFGEVQTPLRARARRTGRTRRDPAASLPLGAHVWLRHAKAGELAEHVNAFVVVSDGAIVDEWPSYRGARWALL